MADASTLSAADLRVLLRQKEAEERKGRESLRAAYDADRDAYVDHMLTEMARLSTAMQALKLRASTQGQALHARMYEAYGRVKKRELDHFSLVSGDCQRKVVIERQHRCAYDETSTVAIETIRQVLRAKFEGRNKTLYAIIDAVLMKNGKGDYDERLVAKLRKHEPAVNDERFTEALNLLARAYRPTHTQTYVRAYRKDANGRWLEVPMSWSALPTAPCRISHGAP
jgi:hypothetical protein